MDHTTERERVTASVLERVASHASAYLASAGQRPVGAAVTPEVIRERVGGPLPDAGTPPLAVIDALVDGVADGLVSSSSGRFFGWVIGAATPAALGADWLASAWDQNAVLRACSPAAAAVEEVAGGWLLDLLSLPASASFAFTTGCQMAHFTALAAARHAVLSARGWDVEVDGLFGAPRIRVLASARRHASVDRALRYLGIGAAAVVPIPLGPGGATDARALERSLDEDGAPTIVVLDAADIDAGVVDDFAALVPIAQRRRAWVHVDGAFGLIARASPGRRAATDGVELADSWATDAHKWLNVPFDCGFCAVRDRDAHRASMSTRASYITADEAAREPLDWTPEWSRRARGFAVYAALRELGRAGVADLVERSCAHARALVDGIGALPGATARWTPTLNQGLVAFSPSEQATDEERDSFTDAIIAAVNATGEAFFSGTTWRGRRAMRVSVVGWRTTADDVERAVAAVREALSSANGGRRRRVAP